MCTLDIHAAPLYFNQHIIYKYLGFKNIVLSAISILRLNVDSCAELLSTVYKILFILTLLI